MEPDKNHITFCRLHQVKPLAQADITDVEGFLLWILFFIVGKGIESSRLFE